MFYKPLLLPLLAQVGLTVVVGIWLYIVRLDEIRRKRIHPNKLTIRSEARNRLVDSAAASDNLQNLFEMPVLFFTALLLAMPREVLA